MRVIEKIKNHSNDFASTPPVLLAFLGDSVTHGCFEVFVTPNEGLECLYDYENVYHSILKRKLEQIYPRCPINILNSGVSGGSAPQGKQRLDRDILRFSPDFISVCFGLNDCGAGKDGLLTYTGALDETFKKLNAEGIETVFLTPNCMNTYVDKRIQFKKLEDIAAGTAKLQNDGILTMYIEAAKEICYKNSVPVCDVYAKWLQLQKIGVDTTMLLSNHINHPTREMHELFANMLFDMIIKD